MTQLTPYGGYQPAPPPRRRGLLLAVAIIVPVVALVTIGGLLYADARGDADDAQARVAEIQRQLDEQRSIADRARTGQARRDEALQAARDSVVQLLSYDYRNYDRYVATVTALATDRFRPEITRTAEAVRQQVLSSRAVLKATVADAAVKSDTPDTAVVLLYVDSTTTSASQPTPRQTRNRIRLTVQKTGERWLVDAIQAV